MHIIIMTLVESCTFSYPKRPKLSLLGRFNDAAAAMFVF
jgi:hypothetical protein